jgi:hypothetical protein
MNSSKTQKNVVKIIVQFIRERNILWSWNFTEELLALGPFGPWNGFLGLGLCLVREITL